MELSNLQIRTNTKPYGTPELDGLSVAYIVINVVWTSIVLVGCLAFWRFRTHETMRKRNPALVVASVLVLHVYFCFNLILYPLNGAYPCALDYWIMSVYFPLGIALFQVQHVQLLSVSARQKELRFQPFRRRDGLTLDSLKAWNFRSKSSQMTLLSRIYYGIAVCVVSQLILCLVFFLVSRKFVPFGVTGEKQSDKYCSHGWEWIITILYQGIWTYVFGPWLLWKIRNIHDVFNWKLQTVLAIVFSLPGLPMWLIATNAPAFQKVTAQFPNGMWFDPGIAAMQIVSLFFPLYEVYKANRRQNSGSEIFKASSDGDLESQREGSWHSMQAFENALRDHSSELLEYAATREFTGENIVFLTRVRDFKAAWKLASQKNETDNLDRRQKFFAWATDIFDRSVSLHTSQFPINIESQVYTTLNEMFGREIVPDSSVVAPFADSWSAGAIAELNKISEKMDDPTPKPASAAALKEGHAVGLPNTSEEHIIPPGLNHIPDDFDPTVFNKAERSVKYMVFTNTWARYVDSWRHSDNSTMYSGSDSSFLKGQPVNSSTTTSGPDW